MSKRFLDDDFLLQNKYAKRFYHQYAKELPIIDYHNHLNPEDIATNKQYQSITELWLQGDHYKWRAMRANGINEKYITGATSDAEKFKFWSATVPFTMRNPLYHWTHLELQRYFGIETLLDLSTNEKIYHETNEMLSEKAFFAEGLLQKMKVEIICTTDNPTDSLEHHMLQKEKSRSFKMLPTFRPDKFLHIDSPDFVLFLEKLEDIVKYNISTFDLLVEALEKRVDFFASFGCKLSDHGLSQLHNCNTVGVNLDAVLQKAKSKVNCTENEIMVFQMQLLHQLGKIYAARGWVMQLHLGALRNTNTRLLNTIGVDAGCDSIGDYEQASGLASFLDKLNKTDQLPKTILYNLNPKDNEVFATMVGNFNDGSTAGKVQWGSGWWFLDQKDGIEKQLNTLSNMGLFSRFLGMLTDSRSMLSFPRHEYFRRILCNVIGKDVQNGLLPNDEIWLGKMVQNICYHNAKEYFEFE